SRLYASQRNRRRHCCLGSGQTTNSNRAGEICGRLRKELNMSVQSVAKKFVELCRQGKNFDVMRTIYAPDIVSVEGDGKETKGQGPVIKKSEDWVSDKTFNGETVAGPFYNGANPDQFVVYFTLDITPKATGKRVTLEEVGVYTVGKDDKITREQFYYEGAH